VLVLDHEVLLPPGTGPRHMVMHPSGHLHVVTEYSCEVFTLAPGPDGVWSVVGSVLASPIAEIGVDFPAELARTRDGQFLYTALRGSNTIAAIRVRGAGEALEPVALADSGVDWPRHHLVHEGKLLVAGQRSDTVTLLDLDERTGAPLGIRHEAQVPSPTHFLLVR
jgi:6-phosphogluconolactonase